MDFASLSSTDLVVTSSSAPRPSGAPVQSLPAIEEPAFPSNPRLSNARRILADKGPSTRVPRADEPGTSAAGRCPNRYWVKR